MLVSELVSAIYEDNFSHLELIWNMGGDCDCVTCRVMATINGYWKADLDEEEGE